MTQEQWDTLDVGAKIQHRGDSPADVFELLIKDHNASWIGLRRRAGQNIELRILREVPSHWKQLSAGGSNAPTNLLEP